MYVDGAHGRDVQDFLRQNLPEGGGDEQIRAQRAQGVQPLLAADALKLQHLKAVPERRFLDRAGRQAMAAPAGPVGLRAHGGDVPAAVQQRFQRRHGKFRRAHEHHARHASLSSPSSSSTSRVILSMNSTPSKWSISWQNATAKRPSARISTGFPARLIPRTTTRWGRLT